MPNLKPYYDAALKADDEVKRILAEMDAAFNEGTDEGKKKALELRPALDEAKTKAEEANKLYASMRDASLVNDNTASLFTTPPDPANQTDQENRSPGKKFITPKSLRLNEYRALSPRDRLAFAKSGGQISD